MSFDGMPVDFELTELEIACGVTLADAYDTACNATVRRFDDPWLLLPANISPALAGAAARMALGGEVEFVHAKHGYPVYQRVS